MKNKLFLILLFIVATGTVYSQDALAHYTQGMKLKTDKKINEAFEKFKKAIALNPKYSDALFQAGWCQNELGNYRSAISYLHKTRQYGPAMAKTFYELGYAFDRLDTYDSALYFYNQCLLMNPQYSLVYKQLGSIAYEKDDPETAIANFTKYESYAKEEIRDYGYWYKKGFCYNALKDYTNAKEALLRSRNIKDDYQKTYLELGFAASRLKQDDEAIGYYKSAVTLDPDSHVAYNGIAEVYRDLKRDMDEAMNWYRKALKINPTERKACFGMGFCLNAKQQYNDAVGYLKTAIEKEPTYTAAYVELGYAYFKTGKDMDAENCFKKAIELSPKNENARYYACLLYVKQKNKVKAQKMVDELKALSSKYASTLQKEVETL